MNGFVIEMRGALCELGYKVTRDKKRVMFESARAEGEPINRIQFVKTADPVKAWEMTTKNFSTAPAFDWLEVETIAEGRNVALNFCNGAKARYKLDWRIAHLEQTRCIELFVAQALCRDVLVDRLVTNIVSCDAKPDPQAAESYLRVFDDINLIFP